jgi:large subunit ribosomal protein L5
MPIASGLKDRYDKTTKTELRKQFNYSNVMQIPRVEKVILNIGMGESIGNSKAMDAAAADLTSITGQRPIVTKSKKLVTVALPRIRDFQGVPDRSFDGRGNYSLGLKEQLVFPEIEYDKIDRLRGMEITIVTTAKTDEEARALLRSLGMPFQQKQQGNN